MEPIPIPVELRCAKCGSKALVAESNLTDDSIIICAACGTEIGRWGDVRQQALKASAEEIKKRLKDEFGDSFDPS